MKKTTANLIVVLEVILSITVGSPGASISRYKSITNAPSIDKLNGSGYQAGRSVAVPVKSVLIALGSDFNIIPVKEKNKTYYGGTVTSGLGFGSPDSEFHVKWGETITIPGTRFNIFDVAESVYNRIMEW